MKQTYRQAIFSKLASVCKENPGVGSHWDNQQFNKDSIESVLHISIISPVLPKGDYTTTQSVLVDDATGEVMAFVQTIITTTKIRWNFKTASASFIS